MYKLLVGKKIPNNIGTFLFSGANTYPYKGVWNNHTAYSAGEAVFYSYNSQYYYASDNIGVDYDPSNPLWVYAGSNSYVDDKFDYALEWKLADLGGDKPAINFQVNNITELKDRQIDYSRSLKLPPTKNNCALFGFSDSFDVVTSFPYQKHNCRLFSNDSVLAGPGSYLILDKVNKFFEVQILSGNVDFFDILKSKEMSELDLGSIVRNLAAFNPANFGGKYEYAAATFTKVAETFFRTDIDDMYPFVLLKPAIESLISQNGYALETNLTDAQWNKKAISLCNLNSSEGSLNGFDAYAGGNSISLNTITHYVTFNINPSGNSRLISFVDGTTKGMHWTCPVDCTIQIVFGVSTPSPLSASNLKIENLTNSAVICDLQNSLNGTFSETVSVNKGDVLQITALKIANSTNTKVSTYTFRISQMVAETVPLDGILHFSPNLGFDTQFELFKAFVQLFGLTVSVDNETKTVYAYTMKKLYDNKAIAKDWSAKLNDVENDTSFVINGYAQNNYISFEASDKVTDRGNFIVENETLDKAKDLFSLKFEAGFDRKVTGWVVANIPLNEIAEDNLTATFTGGKPHIVELSTNTIEFIINGSVYLYHIATHAKAQTFVDSFYSDLQTMLTNAKWKEDEFCLTDQDIEEYKSVKDGVPGCFVPVYIQKYGAYFYVNKIKNFVSGVLTKCELVRL